MISTEGKSRQWGLLGGLWCLSLPPDGILSELVGTSMFSEYIRPHPPACSVSTYVPLLYYHNTVRSCHGGTVLHSRRIWIVLLELTLHM